MFGEAPHWLSMRVRAYRMAFGSAAGQNVLADLAKFCRATESTFHADERLHAVMEGRREVWLRIQRHLRLNEEQIYALLMAQAQQQEKTNAS